MRCCSTLYYVTNQNPEAPLMNCCFARKYQPNQFAFFNITKHCATINISPSQFCTKSYTLANIPCFISCCSFFSLPFTQHCGFVLIFPNKTTHKLYVTDKNDIYFFNSFNNSSVNHSFSEQKKKKKNKWITEFRKEDKINK